jgi:hypothetical protein
VVMSLSLAVGQTRLKTGFVLHFMKTSCRLPSKIFLILLERTEKKRSLSLYILYTLYSIMGTGSSVSSAYM